jgi:prepilin-type N-terminal cleavage/methylation domain-containing protein
MQRSKSGFSLVELLITLAIGVAGLAVAAHFAGAAIKTTSRGDQLNNLSAGTRLIGRQLRTDLRLAGYGTTGAIGIQAGGFFAGVSVVVPTSGFAAMPVIQGVDNLLGGELGGAAVGSDAISIVVVDPSRTTQTTDTLLTGSTPTGAPACDADQFVFLADYSSANGAGRSQIFGPTDTLAFNAAPGSVLSCARISIYWLDSSLLLRRTELRPAGPAPQLMPSPAAGVPWQGDVTSPAEVVTPGVLDFQVAYAFSSELAGRAGTGDARWAYSAAGTVDPTSVLTAWFEVRQVRASMYVRTLRTVEGAGRAGAASEGVMVEQELENAPAYTATQDFARAYGRVRVVTSETLQNLRFFDMNLPLGVPAEPY